MKIGIDIRCLCEEKYSGISEYTYNLVKHLLAIDQENEYYLFYNAAKAQRVPKFDGSNVFYKGFKYPNKLFNLGIRFLKITSLDKLLGGVDVFVTTSFLFTNLSKDCKKVLIIHDLSFELYPEFFTAKIRLWHNLINPKKISKESDRIIAISQNTSSDIQKNYQISPEKIDVVYNGINEMYFNEIKEEDLVAVKSKYSLPEKYIFSLGNLEPRKNIESLIRAFENVEDQNVHLIIAGSQAWKYDSIYNIWQNSKAKDRIKFLGYVDAKDKPALYNLATVFVYPSIYEGFGLPPIEAMACKTPVISSFTSSLVESVADAGVLIDPNNINDIAQAINKLLNEPDLREELIKKGLEHSKKFNWDDASQKILKIIKEV